MCVCCIKKMQRKIHILDEKQLITKILTSSPNVFQH